MRITNLLQWLHIYLSVSIFFLVVKLFSWLHPSIHAPRHMRTHRRTRIRIHTARHQHAATRYSGAQTSRTHALSSYLPSSIAHVRSAGKGRFKKKNLDAESRDSAELHPRVPQDDIAAPCPRSQFTAAVRAELHRLNAALVSTERGRQLRPRRLHFPHSDGLITGCCR